MVEIKIDGVTVYVKQDSSPKRKGRFREFVEKMEAIANQIAIEEMKDKTENPDVIKLPTSLIRCKVDNGIKNLQRGVYYKVEISVLRSGQICCLIHTGKEQNAMPSSYSYLNIFDFCKDFDFRLTY